MLPTDFVDDVRSCFLGPVLVDHASERMLLRHAIELFLCAHGVEVLVVAVEQSEFVFGFSVGQLARIVHSGLLFLVWHLEH